MQRARDAAEEKRKRIGVIIDSRSLSLSEQPTHISSVESHDSEGMTAKSFPANKRVGVTRRSNSLADKVDHRALPI